MHFPSMSSRVFQYRQTPEKCSAISIGGVYVYIHIFYQLTVHCFYVICVYLLVPCSTHIVFFFVGMFICVTHNEIQI